MDDNVHMANTMRLADALIKANKRFDQFILPGQRHSYAAGSELFLLGPRRLFLPLPARRLGSASGHDRSGPRSLAKTAGGAEARGGGRQNQ